MTCWALSGMVYRLRCCVNVWPEPCRCMRRFQKLTERQARTMKNKKTAPVKFSWIHNRPVDVLPI